MKYDFDNLNLVVIFSEIGKHMIKLNELTTLMENETPSVNWDNNPIAPGFISYQNYNLEISIIGNKLQINSKTSNNNIPLLFFNTLQKTLMAAKERSISAYGFNFFFSCIKEKSIKEIFNISFEAPSFEYQTINTSLQLMFKRGNLLFNFDVTEQEKQLLMHVNVHHDEATPLENLASNIEKILKEDFTNTQQLLKEVFGLND